ncbi:hypothetical protein AB6A40_000769 [Gnathostoma spinigerum]|uniref:BTB domain-containing protein n=1 Tax=Gnathostoma spinigerum TaxID=75299 RepID=A0ABD6E2Q3_9BILA
MTDVAQNALNKPLKKQHTYDRKATDHELYFQYEWPVRVTKRRISETDEVILNVSPPFSTSFNGVQFTWALRLSDECIETGNPEEPSSTVNIYLYYKEGPIQVVHLLSASVTVMDSSGGVMFSELPIKETEWTRGSGWPVDSEGKQMQCLTKYVHENVNGIIKAVANIRMEPGAFYPLLYLPTLSDKNRQLAEACKDYLRHAAALNSIVPGTTLSLRDVKPKMYSMHKLILTNACLEIDRRLLSVYDPEQLRNLFAHIYFNERIVPHVTRLEDYIELIEGYHASDALTLVREAERFICSRMNMVRFYYSHASDYILSIAK